MLKIWQFFVENNPFYFLISTGILGNWKNSKIKKLKREKKKNWKGLKKSKNIRKEFYFILSWPKQEEKRNYQIQTHQNKTKFTNKNDIPTQSN